MIILCIKINTKTEIYSNYERKNSNNNNNNNNYNYIIMSYAIPSRLQYIISSSISLIYPSLSRISRIFLISLSVALLNPGTYPYTLAGSKCFPNLFRSSRHLGPVLREKRKLILKSYQENYANNIIGFMMKKAIYPVLHTPVYTLIPFHSSLLKYHRSFFIPLFMEPLKISFK